MWKWFCEIVEGSDAGGFGFQPVTWAQVRAWSELAGVRLEPWEARAIVRVGVARVRVLNRK